MVSSGGKLVIVRGSWLVVARKLVSSEGSWLVVGKKLVSSGEEAG